MYFIGKSQARGQSKTDEIRIQLKYAIISIHAVNLKKKVEPVIK